MKPLIINTYTMRIFLLLSFMCGFLCTQTVYAQTAKGIVFEDINQNGKKDKKEKALANIAVSNGVDVVLTNAKGEYVLPVGNDNIVFVIKPSGYKPAVDQNNLPRYYYIHKPNGSPKLKFEGVQATGALPKSIDFGLIPTEEKDEFQVLVFGDPQVYNEEQVKYLEKGVVALLKNNAPYEFGISLGDLVGNKPSLFNPYIQAIKQIGIPWYQVMGNHDMNFDVSSDSLSDESFEAHFGPNNYAFNYGKVHFIVLDDILYQGQNAKKPYIGGLRKDQLDFVENTLKYVPKDHLIVLCAHIPFVNGTKGIRKKDSQRLFSLLKDYPHTFSMSAHTHIQKQIFIGQEDGWQQSEPHHHYNVGTTSGNWYSGEFNNLGVPYATMADGTLKGWAVATFKGNTYEVDYHVAGKPSDFKMNVFLPKIVQKKKNPKTSVYVNYFLGGDKDTLYCRVDGGKWQKMKKTEMQDPHHLLSVIKWDTAETLMRGERPSDPGISTHIWKAPVPSDLPVGEHTMEFRINDMFGRQFYSTATYRIENARN